MTVVVREGPLDPGAPPPAGRRSAGGAEWSLRADCGRAGGTARPQEPCRRRAGVPLVGRSGRSGLTEVVREGPFDLRSLPPAGPGHPDQPGPPACPEPNTTTAKQTNQTSRQNAQTTRPAYPRPADVRGRVPTVRPRS